MSDLTRAEKERIREFENYDGNDDQGHISASLIKGLSGIAEGAKDLFGIRKGLAEMEQPRKPDSSVTYTPAGMTDLERQEYWETRRHLEQAFAEATDSDAKKFYGNLLRLHNEEARRPYIQQLVNVLENHIYHPQ